MEVIKRKITENRAAILKDFDLNQELLNSLLTHEVITLADCAKLQQLEDRITRSRAFLEIIQTRVEGDDVYRNLLMCLHLCGQAQVAALLTDVKEEMRILVQLQASLDTQVKEIGHFLTTEERRTGVYLTEPPPDGENITPALKEKELMTNVQGSLKRSQQQLARCQAVIQKLHKDCETVAKQNSDIVEQTKECDAKIKALLNVGRQSARQKAVPKKTQDLFANLMDDIEKLVKTRRKVLDKETEGRRHSTRIIRQCRDWIESRSLALKKLNNVQGSVATKGLDTSAEGEITVSVHREAPPVNDNAVFSVLESLQLLEKDLQEYVHQEITLSDRFRQELRRKHLQRKVHGLNSQGLEEIENALQNLEKNPVTMKESLEEIKTRVRQINQEYCECVKYLNKVDSGCDNSVMFPVKEGRGPKVRPRNWPLNFKQFASLGGNLSRSLDNNMDVIGKVAPNELLNRIRSLAVKHEELQNEERNINSKFRTEISKQKRDMELLMQRKEDQILKLQTDVKEITAEKEKYKKLYNDTKIGYQKNLEQLTSPR